VFDFAVRNLALLAAAPLLALSVPMPAYADDVPPTTTAPTETPVAAATPMPADLLTSQVVTMTNQLRGTAGCGQLDVDQDLIVASERQSWYMAETRNFSHIGWGGSTFITRAQVAGYEQPAGENIAWGYLTAEEVMAAWMASPGHRANILNCATKSIGAGVTYATDGTPYYAEVFGWQ
jgi:uncharacterized protein YkwD